MLQRYTIKLYDKTMRTLKDVGWTKKMKEYGGRATFEKQKGEEK
jgi:hypothetical protein